MSLIALAAATLLAVWAPNPQESLNRDCLDDNGVDRCARLAEDVRALGMSALEDEKNAGTEVYRIIQVDGYGRLMPAVAYERRVGSEPQVTVYGHDGARMTATVSPLEWRSVQNMALLADRQIVPLPEESGIISLCLHAWLSTVEIANAADRGRPTGPIRRRTESACEGGLTSRFAFDLTAMAIKRFPACDILDPRAHGNAMTRLGLCVHIRGDRMAAAELLNQTGQWLEADDGDDLALAWARQLRPRNDAHLDWAGRQVAGGQGAGASIAAFMARVQADNPSLRAHLSSFNAVSSTRVEVSGAAMMDDPQDEVGPQLYAAFQQAWVWDSNSLVWTLESWVVEPFSKQSLD